MQDFKTVAGLLLEHQLLGRAIASAKIQPAPDSRIPSTTPLLVAWSPREEFLIRPEYAWLTASGASFLQLPVSLDHFMQVVTAHRPPAEPGSEFHSLLTSVGQWRWAVGELGKAISIGRYDEAQDRVRALLSYARQHWPGIFEDALNVILEGVGRASHRTLLLSLAAEVQGVAAAQACLPLARWCTEAGLRARIGELQDLLCYFQQNLVQLDSIKQAIERDPWWSELARDLDLSQRSLQTLQYELGDCSEPFTDCCESAGRSLREVESIHTLSPRFSRDDARRILVAIENLVLAIEESTRMTRTITERIAQACGEMSIGSTAP
jgi:hypothetical protein